MQAEIKRANNNKLIANRYICETKSIIKNKANFQ